LQICNLDSLSFDVTGSAALYSQMAGVLAAFAFGAVSLVLPGMHRRNSGGTLRDAEVRARSDSQVLLALISAFLGLIVATLQYAVLAGERGCALIMGRASSEEFLGGVSFAFAVLLLLYAIVQLVTNSEIEGLSYHARLIVTALGAPLALLFLTTGAVDVASTPWLPDTTTGGFMPNLTTFGEILNKVSLPLPGAVFVLCLGLWRLGRGRRRTPPATSTDKSSAHFIRVCFPYVSLALAISATIRSENLAITDPAAHIQDWEVWLWLGLCTAILVTQAALLSFDQGSEHGLSTTGRTR
jgi:hypothetical protein